jgi:hypothetical protein
MAPSHRRRPGYSLSPDAARRRASGGDEYDWPMWLGEEPASEQELLALLRACPDEALKILAGRQNGRQRKKQWASANIASATITQKQQTRPYAVLVGGGLDNRGSEHLFRPGARRWLRRPATTASSQAGAAILSSSTGTRRAQQPVVHWRRMDQTALERVMIWQLPISCLALRLRGRAMDIEGTKFGSVTIDRKTYQHDVVIRLSGEVIKRKKKLSKKYYGTSHVLSKDEAKFVFEKGCEQLIIGSGQIGNVHLSPEAEAYFAKKGCKVLLQPTPEAIDVFNKSHAKKIGLFHVTC